MIIIETLENMMSLFITREDDDMILHIKFYMKHRVNNRSRLVHIEQNRMIHISYGGLFLCFAISNIFGFELDELAHKLIMHEMDVYD